MGSDHWIQPVHGGDDDGRIQLCNSNPPRDDLEPAKKPGRQMGTTRTWNGCVGKLLTRGRIIWHTHSLGRAQCSHIEPWKPRTTLARINLHPYHPTQSRAFESLKSYRPAYHPCQQPQCASYSIQNAHQHGGCDLNDA